LYQDDPSPIVNADPNIKPKPSEEPLLTKPLQSEDKNISNLENRINNLSSSLDSKTNVLSSRVDILEKRVDKSSNEKVSSNRIVNTNILNGR